MSSEKKAAFGMPNLRTVRRQMLRVLSQWASDNVLPSLAYFFS